MKPAANLREIVPGAWVWSAFHEKWKVDFCSAAWRGSDGLALIDPIRLEEANLARLEQIGRPAAILLTNQNHERDAEWFRQRYGIKVHVHRDAVPGIEITPDSFFCDGAILPGGLKAIHLPGASLSESAFYTEASGGIVFLGDMAIHSPGNLHWLPAEHCQDAKRNRDSAQNLLGYSFETVTFAHGAPISPDAKSALAKLIAR